MSMRDSPCGPESQEQAITEPNLLLAEGADMCGFCKWAVRAYRLTGFQVIDFEGNRQFRTKLRTLKEITGFERNAKAIVVVRDAETSASAEADSIRGALRDADFQVPAKAFEIANGDPRTAFVLFPGLNEAGKLFPAGTLEDLCLATAKSPQILACVDSFLLCCKEAGADMRRPHKMKLHAYLAGQDKFVGMKIGEAAAAGAWNWDHPKLKPFKELLRQL